MIRFLSNIITLVIALTYRRIKDLREDNDWTQQNIADMLHISRSAYSAYENGTNAVPIEVLIRLSDIFGTSIDYLLELTNNPSPYKRKSDKAQKSRL